MKPVKKWGLMKKYYRSLLILLAFLSLVSVCKASQNPVVVLETNFGDIHIELYPQAAPVTVDNFLHYVTSGFYDGLLFHRAENRDQYGYGLDVIQGGGFFLENNYIYQRTPGNPIIIESSNGLSNVRGTIAMARTAEPNSATSQFFINHQDNTELDYGIYSDGYGYCVYGKVIQGMDVVDNIAQTNVVIVSGFTNFFPYNPTVDIDSAFVLACDVSYCSDFVSPARISFEDFALFASNWTNDACASVNGFCNGADLDYSGTVDMADLIVFLDHWTQMAGYEPFASDLVSDNTIILEDFSAFIDNWLDFNCDDSNQFCNGADINRDGSVDFIDFAQMAHNWLAVY